MPAIRPGESLLHQQHLIVVVISVSLPPDVEHLELKHQRLAGAQVVGVELDPRLAHLEHDGRAAVGELDDQALGEAPDAVVEFLWSWI